jgi:hypothetical protein
VPYRLIHQTVDLRLSAMTVEVLQRGTRIWMHRRSHHPGFTTVPEHMPHAHRAHLEWSPSRLIRWGATVGPHTAALVEQILASRPRIRAEILGGHPKPVIDGHLKTGHQTT